MDWHGTIAGRWSNTTAAGSIDVCRVCDAGYIGDSGATTSACSASWYFHAASHNLLMVDGCT
jgi:hypothetical protein